MSIYDDTTASQMCDCVECKAFKHTIKWYVYADGEKIRRTATMRGDWGYDATCSCGWETNTGGAIKRVISDEVWIHKLVAKG